MKLPANPEKLKEFYFLDREKVSEDILNFLIFQDRDFEEKYFIKKGEHFVIGVKRQEKGYIKFLYGLDKEILQKLERRLIEDGVNEIRVFESAPRYMFPGVDPRYTEIYLFFLENGYQVFEYTFNMEVEVLKPCKVSLPEDIILRRATREDEPLLKNFLKTHFLPWEEEVLTAFLWNPPRVVLAIKDGEICGFSAFDTNNPGTGWFGPMGVNKSLRGKGIGKALLLETLNFMYETGYRKITIPWVGPVSFYHRTIGARVKRVFLRMRKPGR